MKKMNKDRLDLRIALNQYMPHKKRLEEIEQALAQPMVDARELPILIEERRLLKEYIDSCDKKIEEIREFCGDKAADIIWDAYVIRLGSEHTALKHGMSKRTLEVWLDFWLDKHFLINKPVEPGETPWATKRHRN